jgi:hypothetical protein
MICMPGIRLARKRHAREVDAIANHPACRSWICGAKRFRSEDWINAGASFFLFEGGWLASVPRDVDAVDLHVAALPGHRGQPALWEIKRVLAYLFEPGSPLRFGFATVSKRNRAVCRMAVAAGLERAAEAGDMVVFKIERLV